MVIVKIMHIRNTNLRGTIQNSVSDIIIYPFLFVCSEFRVAAVFLLNSKHFRCCKCDWKSRKSKDRRREKRNRTHE